MDQGLLRMGDLTRDCGVSDQAVRLYERLGLLQPLGRTAQGYRRYDAAALETLRFIKRAQRSGFSLEEIKALLHADIRDAGACELVKALLDRKLRALRDQRLELLAVENILQGLRQACEGERGPSCPTLFKLCHSQGVAPDPQPPGPGGVSTIEVRHDP